LKTVKYVRPSQFKLCADEDYMNLKYFFKYVRSVICLPSYPTADPLAFKPCQSWYMGSYSCFVVRFG